MYVESQYFPNLQSFRTAFLLFESPVSVSLLSCGGGIVTQKGNLVLNSHFGRYPLNLSTHTAEASLTLD